MLLDTLKAMVNAGRDALQTTCGLPVRTESVSQLTHGSIIFPALADLRLSSCSLSRVHMGCDALLCGRLAELVDIGVDGSGLAALTSSFLAQLIEEVPGRNPHGCVESLAVEPLSIRTRGVRTFGFRFETTAGQMFLLAEVPSRAEWERERGGEFISVMAESYLPDGWAGLDRLVGRSEIESFLVFLRKTELDVELQMPGPDQHTIPRSTFLVEQTHHDGERALMFALSGVGDARGVLLPGAEIPARVGLDERSLEFSLRYLGRSSYRVGGEADLECAMFSVPDEVSVAQRRQSFRIPLDDDVVADLIAPALGDPRARRREPPRTVSGYLGDLSFSGARLTIDSSQPESCLEDGAHVRCLLHLPMAKEPVEVEAIVRRSMTTLTEGAHPREEIGLEFTGAVDGSSAALETIRAFVLDEQRAWLARRIQVAGVDDW